MGYDASLMEFSMGPSQSLCRLEKVCNFVSPPCGPIASHTQVLFHNLPEVHPVNLGLTAEGQIVEGQGNGHISWQRDGHISYVNHSHLEVVSDNKTYYKLYK